MWRKGFACSAIGRTIGCSRNAVIGKLHRLGEAKRGTNKRIITQREKAQRKATLMAKHKVNFIGAPMTQVRKIAQLVAEPLPPVNENDVARVKSLFDLEPHHCRWPIDVEGQKHPGYCGDKKVPGLSYCKCHSLRAWAPAQSRQSKQARAQAEAAAIRENQKESVNA